MTAELCKSLSFPDVFPPTAAEQRCNELLDKAEGTLPKIPLTTREEDLSHLTAEICKNLAFLHVFPPTPAQLKCEELLKDAEKDLPTFPNLPEITTREEDLSHLTAEICKHTAFLDVMPPTPAELKCRELLKDARDDLPTLPILPREEEDLSHLTKEICENSAFLMIFPPTAAELKCREILGDQNVKRDVMSVKRMSVEKLTPDVCKALDLTGPVELPKVVREQCDELLGIKLPVLERREEDDLSHLTAEICKTLVFPAVMPPTKAELKCRELLGEEDVFAV